MKEKSKIGYVCGVAWDHELGNTDVLVYATPEELKEEHSDDCGIVEIKISFIKRVEEYTI